VQGRTTSVCGARLTTCMMMVWFSMYGYAVAEMLMRELVDDVKVHGVLLMTFTDSSGVRSALRCGSAWCVAANDVVLGLTRR
jgi:hypothetical protein